MLTIAAIGIAPPPGLAAVGKSLLEAAQPVGKSMVEAFIATPLYQALVVPQARATMVKTAEANGVPWTEAKEWIEGQGDWEMDEAALAAAEPVDVPEYYRRPFHAYDEGNLCWEAAWEQEVAGRAVGARNFPAYGSEGEDAFRGAFDDALDAMGAHCPPDATLVDFGCATGVSTRRLAERYPQARSIVGLDLSPHFLAVGRRLQALAPGRPPWVNAVDAAPLAGRVEYRRADCAATGLADGSADAVSLSLVIHELPPSATRAVCAEALRVLKPGGQLWVTEMDFESEAYAKLRANPMLFSLVRSTEPYLDEYADYQPSLPADLVDIGFGPVKLQAATGRHFACVATKPVDAAAPRAVDDRRAETAKEDTHLRTFVQVKSDE